MSSLLDPVAVDPVAAESHKDIIMTSVDELEIEIEKLKRMVGNILLIIYTVGRYNPVHEGHMSGIIAAIQIAKRFGGKALILAGNGTTKTKMDNPLDFELKERIIRQHIPSELKGSYEIQEIIAANTVVYVNKFILNNMSTHTAKVNSPVPTPVIVHLTANKDGKNNEKPDAQKLSFINKYLRLGGYEYTYSLAIPPYKSRDGDMSATEVRKLARDHTKTLEDFKREYERFYGNETDTVYHSINNYEDVKLSARSSKPKDSNSPSSKRRKSAKTKGGTRKRKHKRPSRIHR
jgi:hypothetical protein